jgi:cobalt-precorrin-6B (C15)-methyltransferase
MYLKGGPTQDEIMAISIQKLELRKGDVFVDIGCGTGKISIEASKTVKKVYAVDIRQEAIEYAKMRARSAATDNIEFFEGSAVEFLKNISQIDCAFVGGTKMIEETLMVLSKKTKGRIVVNAVLIDSVKKAIDIMKDMDIFKEVIHVQVSRSYMLSSSIMFKPIDPVYIIIGGNDRC